MKVLDLPDEEDNPVRQLLLKQDDKTLEEFAKKPQVEIQTFLIQLKECNTNKIEEDESQEQNIETQKNNEKFNRLLSAFPKSVLDKNQDIATMLDEKNFEKLLSTLKDPKILKSITDQL